MEGRTKPKNGKAHIPQWQSPRHLYDWDGEDDGRKNSKFQLSTALHDNELLIQRKQAGTPIIVSMHTIFFYYLQFFDVSSHLMDANKITNIYLLFASLDVRFMLFYVSHHEYFEELKKITRSSIGNPNCFLKYTLGGMKLQNRSESGAIGKLQPKITGRLFKDCIECAPASGHLSI